MGRQPALTRRALLERAAAGAATTTLAGGFLGRGLLAPAAAAGSVVPLPDAARVRADYQRMVDFGPRLPGTVGHDRHVGWLADEFSKAGLEVLPCDEYPYTAWEVQKLGLSVAGKSYDVPTAYVRSQETGPQGLTAPLVYGGAAPAPSLQSTDPEATLAAIQRYPLELASWAQGVTGTTGGGVAGSILVIDLPLPAPATLAAFLAISTYRHWPGHTDVDWAQGDYKRLWLGPWPELGMFADLGAKAVILVVDASMAELKGNFSPHIGPFQSIPGFVVDRATGQALREQAASRPEARLTLEATRVKTSVEQITAVLPGESRETICVTTHTDGQNVIEENASVALLHMARHFASLPKAQRLKRTLVFGLWPAHMSSGEVLSSSDGWMAAHGDIVANTVAALTPEHLGCTEWLDSAGSKGYHATGTPEAYGIWTSQSGPLFDLTRDALVKADLHKHSLMSPAVPINNGVAFHDMGIPIVAGIAGPNYLLVVSESSEVEKLDPELASRQTGFWADCIRRIDGVSKEDLASGDPFLGSGGLPEGPAHTKSRCGPVDRFVGALPGGGRLNVRFYGRRQRLNGGILVTLGAIDGRAIGITVELRRGKSVFAKTASTNAGATMRQVVLRRKNRARFKDGSYTMIVRQKGKVLLRRTVTLGMHR